MGKQCNYPINICIMNIYILTFHGHHTHSLNCKIDKLILSCKESFFYLFSVFYTAWNGCPALEHKHHKNWYVVRVCLLFSDNGVKLFSSNGVKLASWLRMYLIRLVIFPMLQPVHTPTHTLTCPPHSHTHTLIVSYTHTHTLIASLTHSLTLRWSIQAIPLILGHVQRV